MGYLAANPHFKSEMWGTRIYGALLLSAENAFEDGVYVR